MAYENRWIRVREDEVVTPAGNPGIYGVVELRNPAVFVIALDEPDTTGPAERDEPLLLMVEVDRYTVGSSLEVVAGGSDGDDPLVGAQRELLEEAGLTASDWTEVGGMNALNGVCVAPEHVFVARGLERAVTAEALAASQDADSITALRWLPFGEVMAMIGRGEIRDSETIAALALAAIHLGRLA